MSPAIFTNLEEAALHFHKTTRTMERWLSDGKLRRVTLDDGQEAFQVSDTPADAVVDRAECENSMSDSDTSDTTPEAESQDRLPGPGSDLARRRTIDPAATVSTTAARVTRRVRDLIGPAFIATLDAAEAAADLVAAAENQVRYEDAFLHVEPLPGQPGSTGWQKIANAVRSCLECLQAMLTTHTVLDSRLAQIDLNLHDAERLWRDARGWELVHMHEDVEPLQARAAAEAERFAAARAALRRALSS